MYVWEGVTLGFAKDDKTLMRPRSAMLLRGMQLAHDLPQNAKICAHACNSMPYPVQTSDRLTAHISRALLMTSSMRM